MTNLNKCSLSSNGNCLLADPIDLKHHIFRVPDWLLRPEIAVNLHAFLRLQYLRLKEEVKVRVLNVIAVNAELLHIFVCDGDGRDVGRHVRMVKETWAEIILSETKFNTWLYATAF